MKIFKVGSSLGSLGRGDSSRSPDLILEGMDIEGEEIEVVKGNIEETNKNIYETVKKNKECVLVGGDHSITYSGFKGFKENFKDGVLVVFDAHVDCCNNFKPCTHEDFLRVLLEDGIVKDEYVYLVGVRKIYDVEEKFLKGRNVNFVDDVDSVKGENIYLSLDIDVVNSKEAPGVIFRVEKGMKGEDVKKMLRKLKERIRVMDLVEVIPEKDENGKTVKLAGSFLNEVL